MTTGQKNVVRMLAVIAVLLGINLIVSASSDQSGTAQPMAITSSPIGSSTLLVRLWSDGRTEANRRFTATGRWVGWKVVPEDPATP